MRLIFDERAWEDYLHWQMNDKKILKRINLLIKETLRNPDGGIGKPEILKQNLSGYCSRRITDEHRLDYRVDGDALLIAQCRFHY